MNFFHLVQSMIHCLHDPHTWTCLGSQQARKAWQCCNSSLSNRKEGASQTLSRSLIYSFIVGSAMLRSKRTLSHATLTSHLECRSVNSDSFTETIYKYSIYIYIVCSFLFRAGPCWPYWHCWLSVLHNSLAHLFAISVGAASEQILVNFLLFRCSHANCEDGAWEAWSARSLELWEKCLLLEVLQICWNLLNLLWPSAKSYAAVGLKPFESGLVGVLRLLCKRNNVSKAPCWVLLRWVLRWFLPSHSPLQFAATQGVKSKNLPVSVVLPLATVFVFQKLFRNLCKFEEFAV